MLPAIGITPRSLEDIDSPALVNNAVARCAGAWDEAYKAEFAQSKYEYSAEKAAAKAFRQAMPPLCGHDNITDFIACVGYGMLIGAIEEENGNRFLYAAQVALSAFAKAQHRTRSA